MCRSVSIVVVRCCVTPMAGTPSPQPSCQYARRSFFLVSSTDDRVPRGSSTDRAPSRPLAVVRVTAS